jgi:hypothetical protein
VPEAMAGAAEWIETYHQFWSGSLDKLAEHLKRNPPPDKKDELP